MYGIGFSTITFFDVALLLGFIVIFSHGYRPRHSFISGVLVATILLLFLNLAIVLPFNTSGDKVAILLRTLRFIFYLLFCLVVISSGLFKFNKTYKVYKFVVIFASLFLLLQFVLLYGFNYSLKGYLPFLPLMREELSSFSENLSASSYARPRSIFDEPSQFGVYASTFIVFDLLFIKKERKLYMLIIILAMVLSASSTAIMGLAVYFIMLLAKNFNKRPALVTSVVILALIAYISINVISGIFVIERLQLLVARLPNSFHNRIEGFIEYGERAEDMDGIQLLFGLGMDIDNMTVWYSGIAKLPLYYGFVGSMFFAFVMIYVFYESKRKQKPLIVFFLIISLFSEVLVSSWLVLLLPLMFGDNTIFYSKVKVLENENITNQSYLQYR